MDELYDLPFNRAPHPMYADGRCRRSRRSSTRWCIMRGCFGGCTFCSITEHEGRVIQNRSAESVLREMRALRRIGDFRGVGHRPRRPDREHVPDALRGREVESKCRRLSCVHPGICENLKTDHGPLIDLMARCARSQGVKHVLIASGVRYDLAPTACAAEYIEELARHHVGGQLSVAPEHVSDETLRADEEAGHRELRALRRAVPLRVARRRARSSTSIPYFISGHPGSTLDDMVELALYLKKKGYRPRQVQDFIPTPMSMAATMYYTGIDR